jgi:hypothetical protein
MIIVCPKEAIFFSIFFIGEGIAMFFIDLKTSISLKKDFYMRIEPSIF